MKKIYIVGALACLMASCKPSVTVTAPLSNGDADFTNYLAIGNSLTAGYADGSLTVSGQLNSYPQRLFEQFSHLENLGARGPFIQPLVTGDNGYPWHKKVLGTVYNSCTGDTSLAPVDYPGSLDSVGSYRFVNTAPDGRLNNIAVPGIRMVDYPVENYAAYAQALGNAPYANRFYNNPAGSPLNELRYRVNNVHPTFFTMWLGSNDVLGYALGGGQGDGTGGASPLILNFYKTTDISPINEFRINYDSAVNVAISTGAGGALINIPDVTSIPYFTTVPANGLVLQRQGQADTLRDIVWGRATWNKVFQVGSNYFIIRDHNNQIRQAVPGELLLLTVPSDSITCAGWGSTKPIPAEYVLTTDELQHIRSATTSFNQFIQQQATLHNLAYIDMNTFLMQIASGYTYNGIKYSTQFVSGGAFSLDGIHLTPRGYALVANHIIKGINSHYHAGIPFTDVNKYPGIKFP